MNEISFLDYWDENFTFMSFSTAITIFIISIAVFAFGSVLMRTVRKQKQKKAMQDFDDFYDDFYDDYIYKREKNK